MSRFDHWSTSVDLLEMMAFVQGEEEDSNNAPADPQHGQSNNFNLLEIGGENQFGDYGGIIMGSSTSSLIGIGDHNHFPATVPSDYILTKSCDDSNLDNLVATLPLQQPGGGGGLHDDDFDKYFLKGQQAYQPDGTTTRVAGNYSETTTNMGFLASIDRDLELLPPIKIAKNVVASVQETRRDDQYSAAATPSTDPNQEVNPLPPPAATPGGRRRGRKPKEISTKVAPKKKKKYELFDPLNPSQNDKAVKNAAQAKFNREKQKQESADKTSRILVLEDKNNSLELQVAALKDDKKSLQLKVIDLSKELSRIKTVLITNAQHIDTVQEIAINADLADNNAASENFLPDVLLNDGNDVLVMNNNEDESSSFSAKADDHNKLNEYSHKF